MPIESTRSFQTPPFVTRARLSVHLLIKRNSELTPPTKRINSAEASIASLNFHLLENACTTRDVTRFRLYEPNSSVFFFTDTRRSRIHVSRRYVTSFLCSRTTGTAQTLGSRNRGFNQPLFRTTQNVHNLFSTSIPEKTVLGPRKEGVTQNQRLLVTAAGI